MSSMVAEKPLRQEHKLDSGLFSVYKVVVRPCTDTDGYYAVCDTPDGGCVTQAKTLQEIQKNMIEAVEFHFEGYSSKLNYYLSFEIHHAADTDN